MVVSVRSLLFDKGEYIMKLSKKKWKSLISGVLLAASASSFLIAPVYAADYSKPLIGTLKKDSEILSPDGNTVTENDGKLIYDFQGKDHTFTITNKDGITARKDSVYNNVGADGSYGTLHIYQTNNKSNVWAGVNGFTANKGIIVVNSNLDITATSEYSSVGIAAANKGNLIINGNVKMRTDNAEKPWGIITKNVHGNIGPGGATSMGGDANYTGARWQPAGISVDHSRGDITINGDVDIAVRGTAVRTDAYQADGDVQAYDLGTISLLGNSIHIDTPYREENFVEGFGKFIEPYYALASYGGTINVNVKNQEAQNGKVEMVGNVLAMKSSDEAGKAMVYQNGRLNIGLTTQDSSWKGVIDNAGTAKAGEVNLWLQNGAQWIYENASRKDGLDASNLADYSRPYYEKYDGISHLSSLVGGKDKASAGIIRVNDNDPIHIANAEGVTKVWYEHDDATPGTIIGGDIKVFNAKTGTEMMLYTGNNGISKGFAEGDTAAEKNNVSEVLNSLAHKLWYMAGDSNLTGSVSIAEGLTASSVTMKTGNITFAEGGQGFYDYTPEKDDKTYATGPIVKSENIGETRESDINGVVSVNVTEAQNGVSGNAPSAMYAAGEAEGPLVVDLQGHTLKLNANNQTANYVSTVYVDENKSMEIKDSKGNGVLKVSAGLGADGNADTKAKYVYGIRVGEGGNLTANTDVEIDGVKSSATQRAYGVYVSTKGNVVFEKDLSIKNVQTGNKVGPNTAGIYADSSSSADAPINITVKGNLNIENVLGSAIRALNTSTISTAGATIKAADMSNGTDYSQYYALQANKGTINLNTGEGITAGILDVTGDMKVTDNKASVINVNMTKGSQWTGAVSNIPSSTYNAPAGQFNLTMAEGSVWNHETGRSVDTLKTTFAGSNVSKLDGSGVIYQNSDKGITVYDYSGDTTVIYGHDTDNPLNITGGDFTVKTAAAGSKITLVTDSQGINAGFEANDTAAEKNNVKEVLNKLANKLFYTGYKDANLAGVVKIADGLTASSVSATVKASGDITFSDGSNGTKKAGQGFYAYTPEEDKPDYKTGAITKSENISLNREVDDKGVAHINVTESNAGNNKFASAIYAGEETSPSKPMTVNMSGKGLALNVAQTGGQAAAIYAGANTYIKVINPSADQKLAITANNTDTRGSHGIYADGNAHLNISGSVEITDIVTKGDSATGINIQGQKSEINIDGPLTISNVKGIRERGAGMNASGIQVTGDTSTVTVSGPVDISGVRGSGIRLTGKDTKVSVGGGTITAVEDSDKSHNFYAVRVDKGTLDINMKDGATGDTTTKITGDMYATGQYGKKVVEYTGGELINWNDAGILNVALTDKDSFWKGVAAYDMYNDDYGSGGNTTHDIGQFNLYLQNGATWTNEQQSHVTTTTIASKNPVWAGSTLATLHGGKDADNAGLIYQKDNNPISVVNYSGHTTVFYDHDAADPSKIIGGSFNITNAAEGSAITFITDNKGITSGFADGDSGDAKDKVANVLNNLAGKLFYKNYTDGHLAGVLKDDGTYVFTADSTNITPEKHLIAGGAWLPQISAAISGSDENHNVTIDMNGNKLTVDTTTDTHTTGIAAVGKGIVNINNAGAMSVSATSTTNGQTGALFVNAGGTINIHNAGADNVLTLRANSAAPANAAVIKSMNGVSGVMSAITVDGLVDILADKSNASGANEAISAVASKVEIGGGVIKAINGAEYAISAYGEFASKNRGQVNVNVKKDAEGAIIGAGNNNVQMEGNVNLGGGMDSAGASADVSIGLNTKESFWKGDVSNTNGSSAGIVNLYMGNGASWTGNNLSGNTVNANLDNATWTGYSNGNAMHLKLDNSIWNVNGASKIASFSGNNGSIIVANNAGDISVADYSGNTNVIYNHDADNPTNILGGSFTIGQANTGSSITLITDNQGITKGFNAYDKAEDQNTVNEVLNKLAQKLFYTANDGKLAGTVKIASGLTASSAALKTGDISFSTDATGTKTPGQGFYKYNEIDDTVITDPITGNLDKKYVSLGIEPEKGIYNFTKDTVINVTKGDYSSNLSAIESSGGPITINADGKNLDVSYHVLKGSNVARAVATGLSYGKSKDITIKAKSLKLSTDTTGFRAQGVYATGGKITIDADTTITTSAQTESNGIYSGSGGTVTMNGNLDIQKDSKAANYIALNSDDNGIININVKDGKAGDGIVKIDGDVYTKSAETYDYWEDETTSTSSTVNLALQGKDSSWNGRSLYEVTSGDDSTSYGTFNLWLTDGATWTNEKNGKEVPSGFTGSHVTSFVGGSDAAHAGNIFQKDSKNLTIDNYSGNTNIYYAHTGNGEAADNYAAGDTIIKHAEEGSVVSMITDNSGIAMDNEYSIANVLNTLAGKLTYSNFVNGENNLTGYVKIADGLTASSKAMQTGDISFSSKDGKGSLKDGSIAPGLTYPDTQTPESSKLNSGITGDVKTDYEYKKDGILKEDGSYVFTQDPTVIEVKEGAAVNATAKDIVIDTTKAKLELKGETGINAENGNVTLNGSTVISGTDAAINAGENANVNVNGNNSALTINGSINADGGNITVDSGNASSTITGDINAANGGSVVISLIEKNSVLNGGYNVDGNSSIALSLANGATWNLTDGEEAAGMSLLRIAKAPVAAPAKGLTINGGKTEAETGYLNMTKRSKALQIADYSGWETIIYNHDNKGSEAQDFKSGDTIIKHAEKDSVVNLITSNKGLSINAETINDTLSALAGKLTYTNYKDGERNLDGKVKIAGGLTSDSVTVAAGDILFSSTDGKGNGVTNLNVQAPDHQTSTSFGSTLTGDTEEDLEYVLGGIVKDGSYKFTENTTINVNGKDARGMDFAEGTVVDAKGKTLTINVTDGTKLNAGISQIKNVDSHVKAEKIVIKLDSNDASGTTHAIHQDKGNLTIDGDVDIDITGQRHTVGVYSHAGSTTINGNVKVVLDGNHGGFAEYGAAGIYAHAGYGGAVGGTVNVNGNVDISGVGNGLFANIGGGTINVNGGRINIIDDNTDTGYSAIYSTCGAINMNTVKDEKGNVIGAGNNKVDITGNVVVSVGAVNYVDCYEYSLVNLGLTTKDSQLTGVIYNEFPEGGKTASQGGNKKLFTGEANLWLQNGATWTNEQQGTLANVYQGEKFTGSRVAKLTGGATAEAAGNIYQKESGALTIDNYSGNTNIFYEHAGDGVTFNAGDTVIKHAEKGSAVNLITSNKGLSINAETINDTLNALAGKLTYSNYAKGERNLDGKVKIAGGLTSDSVTMAVGDILFNEADGKGSGAQHITVPSAPENQVSTSFNTTLTGDKDKDLEYVLGGVIKDGSYKFTEATSINVSGEGAKGMNFAKGTAIDAGGKTLTINVTDASKGNAGIAQDIDVNSSVKADKLVIKLDSTKSGQGAQGIRQTKGNLTVDGNVDIDVKGDNSTMGVYSHAGSTTINGDVKVVLDGNRGGFNEYGASGLYAHAGYGGAVGGTINVNGNVDISGVGNGLFANIGGATINVNGGKINIVDTDKKNGYSAIYAANGKINVNTVKDADGKVTGAGNNKVDITGNIVTSVGAVNYVDCSTETEVNVGLTTKDSKLTGVVYNQFPEGGKTVSQKGDSKTFTGATNLWLQNGATWTNEQQGVLPSVWGGEQFKGSRVNKLAGGATAEAAGNIYQNDSNSLTIDNYSGVTNIIYAHGGDGTSYAAGDTVIKHAEAGSVVNMITSNQGVTDISAALNALAGKLTYLNYATANGSERNLNGYVKLAGGLTSDSVTMVTGDIRFSEETGKGSGTDNIKFADEPDNQTAKTFNSTLTGERLKDLEYVMGGVVKDGTYKFTENTAINVSGEGAKGMDFVKDTAVDASGKTLSVNVTEASKGNAGISQDVDVNSTIKADKLVIKLDSEKSGKGAQAIRQDKGNLTIDANVDIDVKGDNSTMGIYSHAGSTTVNGDVKVVLDGKRGGFNEYGAAGIYAHAGYGGAVGGTVNVNGNVDISGVGNGLFANIGGATINVNGGKINIVDTDKKNGYSAIYATCGAINMNTVKDAAGKVIGAGNNKVDITGNVVVSVGAVNYVDCCTETEVNLGLTTKDSKLTGVVYNQFPEGGKTVSQRGDSKTFTGAANLWLQNGALWTNEQQGELPSVWGGEQFKGSYVTNLVGGTNADNAGQIYQKDSNNLTIDTLSGSIRVIYDHEFEDAETRAAGDKKIVYKAGDTVINNAKDGSQVIMATGSNGINTFDKDSVEDAFKGLANKLIYKDAEKNPGNLKAELQLGGGLTGSNVSWSGEIEWDGNNGSYKLDSAEQSIKLLYDEDAVSKDTRAAIMSGMVGWRNAATDTYRARAGAYGEDNQGVWARTWGGQNKYTGNNTSFKNSYWAGQVGYDKTLANGWNVGVAFDYMTGDDSYYAGSGDTKTYTLGLYGSKEISNNEFIDLTAKVGRVSNDFETKDILGRTVKGDYKANGFSFSGQYSKRFGSEAAGYFEPQAQLTIGRLGSCDFDSTGTLEGHISQDAFTSIVGRLGIEAGQASEHGRYFARLSLSHEFAGDVDTHFSDSSASMTREFNLDGTWCDLTVGGTYDLSDKVSFYGDVTKTLTGDYKQDWKVNAGLRFTF